MTMTSIRDDVDTTNVSIDIAIDIVKSQHPALLEDEKIIMTSSCQSSLSFLGSDESFIVPLKVDRHTADKKDEMKFDDDDEHDCTTTTTSTSTSSSPCASDDDDDDVRCRHSVGFSKDVSVRIIPRRCDYPKELRRIIFPNRKELSSNAARNMIEFEYEGFDWRNVKEDHEMYINANGERVHPVHWTKIWATRVIPTPSVQNLPKPRPQRPTVSSSSSSVHSYRMHLFDNHGGEPVARPPTPSPYKDYASYTIESVIG